VRLGEGFGLQLEPVERLVLQDMPNLVDAAGDAGGRLDYSAHPDDAEADARYRDLTSDSLNDLRQADRSRFESVVSGAGVSGEDVEAFMRLVGEARIVLAARLGIEDDGWEAEADPTLNPEIALLGWLGYLQDAAVEALSALL
jgi:hypothetical protein